MKRPSAVVASTVIAAILLAGCSSIDSMKASSETLSATTGKLVTVDASSPSGTRLGSFKKGQIITLQYADGVWTVWADAKPPWPEQSPDDLGKISAWHRSALCKYDGQKNVLVTLLPGGTQKTSFIYTMLEDAEMSLACNDVIAGNRTYNNKGKVSYRLDVK